MRPKIFLQLCFGQCYSPLHMPATHTFLAGIEGATGRTYQKYINRSQRQVQGFVFWFTVQSTGTFHCVHNVTHFVPFPGVYFLHTIIYKHQKRCLNKQTPLLNIERSPILIYSRISSGVGLSKGSNHCTITDGSTRY